MEGKESPGIFHASLGFDFIFSRDENNKLHCYCIEINGHDSGVRGVQDIPDDQIDKTHKIVAEIRATVNPEMRRKYGLANEILHDIHVTGEFAPSEEGKEKITRYINKSLRTAPTFTHAHHNPDFIEDITRDKRLQEKYIPKEYQPRIWREGDDPVSSTGRWIVKHFRSRGGDGVHVIPNDQFLEFIAQNKNEIDKYVVQELLMSSGAQMVPESQGKRAASMRLLMDFRYLDGGTIAPDFITAYQRVAPYDTDKTKDDEGNKLTWEDAYVVNRARGATSAAASSEEITMAREAAEKIIKNIASAYIQGQDSD